MIKLRDMKIGEIVRLRSGRFLRRTTNTIFQHAVNEAELRRGHAGPVTCYWMMKENDHRYDFSGELVTVEAWEDEVQRYK